MPRQTSAPRTNPPVRLAQPPKDGCLHEEDGNMFADIMQAGRIAANKISGLYPAVRDPDRFRRVSEATHTMLVVSHLTALMYTFWDQAPDGGSAYDVAMRSVSPDVRAVLRAEAFHWGTRRLVPPPGTHLILVGESPLGSVVADPVSKTFFLVLGVDETPARKLRNAGARLPARVRLTALPFRGVLVCDGVLGRPGGTHALSGAEKRMVLRDYARARKNGRIVTGMNVGAPPDPPLAPDMASLAAMDDSELRQFIRLRNGAPAGAHGTLLREAGRVRLEHADEKGVRCGPMGLHVSEGDEGAPGELGRLVIELKGMRKMSWMATVISTGALQAGGSDGDTLVSFDGTTIGAFESCAASPSALEVLRELVRCARLLSAVPSSVCIEDVNVARRLDEMTRGAGVQFAVYALASAEEQEFLATVPAGVIAGMSEVGGRSPAVVCTQISVVLIFVVVAALISWQIFRMIAYVW